MLFSSIPFLFGFLPIVVLVYFAAPNKLKNIVLLLASLFFYFYGEPRFCIIMVASSLLGYGFGWLLHITKNKKSAKLVLWVSILCCLAPLLIFKYSDFFIENINAVFGGNMALPKLALPIGISFYTFQILSYLLDVYWGKAELQKNPLSFMTYVALFPQLIAGPIVRYQTVERELNGRTHSIADLSAGITRFCVGLGKKVIIADSLASLYALLAGQASRSVLSYWVCSIAFTLQVYFDFSGYSDMAIGLGRMFGFHFLENFDHPYASSSITEFWRRWHVSLGSWFRDYVYIPLGGNRCPAARRIVNIIAVWLLTGLWHGAAWNFVLWGLYFALFLLMEKAFLLDVLAKIPRFVRILYTLLTVNLGFCIFNGNSLPETLSNLGGMFGAGNLPLADGTTVYYLLSFSVVLAIAAIGASPLPQKLGNKLRSTKLSVVWEPLFCLCILLLVAAYLVDGSFSPFLYFRF